MTKARVILMLSVCVAVLLLLGYFSRANHHRHTFQSTLVEANQIQSARIQTLSDSLNILRLQNLKLTNSLNASVTNLAKCNMLQHTISAQSTSIRKLQRENAMFHRLNKIYIQNIFATTSPERIDRLVYFTRY